MLERWFSAGSACCTLRDPVSGPSTYTHVVWLTTAWNYNSRWFLLPLWTLDICIHTCPHTHTGEDRHIRTQIYTSTIKKNHHWWTTHCPFLIIREQIRIAHRLTKKGDQVKIHICRLPRYFRSASSSKNPLKSRDKRCCTLVLCSCSVSVLREERTGRKWRLGRTSRILAELLRSFRSPLNHRWPHCSHQRIGEPGLPAAHEGVYLTTGKNAFPSCSYFMISFFKSTGLMFEWPFLKEAQLSATV